MAVLAGFFLMSSCGYDDTLVREEIGKVEAELSEYEQKMADLESQLSSLTALINSSFISYLGTDEAGNYVISYMDKGGDVKTVVVAVDSDVVTAPLIGTAEFEGVLYWTSTADNGKTWDWILDAEGNKMPVGGVEPEVKIDAEGFWTVNGARVIGADGKPVLANDVSNTLFKEIKYNEETGFVEFTLVDGSVFSVRMYEALNIEFDAPAMIAVPDPSAVTKVAYTVTGSQASDAVVDYFTAYNVTVEIDKYAKTINVTLAEGAEEGNTVIMVSAGENVVLKPLFFTAGAAEIQKPVWDNKYGAGTEIQLPGDLTEFEIEVSHNISYEMSISEDCADWLKVAPSTKAEMITTKHSFVADYYESSLGADRKGKIIFRNDLYDVTVEIAVRQTPIVPSGPVVPGISTGADLVAFAKAVNSGASTSRWQNEAGEVVLLNDIDLTGMTEWTPIGSGTAKGTPAYDLVAPFSGVFNGQGFAIKGIQWVFNVTDTPSHLYGLFGAMKDATVKNLVLGAEGDQITIVGSNPNVIAVGALVGHAESSTILGISNNVSVVLADKNAEVPGDNPDATLMMLGGVAGTFRAPMTVGSKDEPVKNFGTVKTGAITNTANGGTGMNVAGVVAFTVGVKDIEMKLDYCYNYGDVSAPTGRGGGIIGTMGGATAETAVTILSNSDNYGTVQDDVVGQFGGSKDMYNLKRMGGLVGGTVTNTVGLRIEYCTNYGNVFSQIGCRTGGFVGHCQASVVGCVNKGIILANISYTDGAPQHGPGWACGYSGKHLVTSCAKGGRVGEWDTYKDNPSAAPEATMDNALLYKNSEYFDPSVNF